MTAILLTDFPSRIVVIPICMIKNSTITVSRFLFEQSPIGIQISYPSKKNNFGRALEH